MKKYDVAIAGGGFAGFAAAVSSAREGMKVILIENSNCLGGCASNCLVNPFMRSFAIIDGEKKELSDGIFMEIHREMQKFDGAIAPWHESGGSFSEEYLKLVMNRMATDAGVELLFHTYVTGVKKNGSRIDAVKIVNKSGASEIFADIFIDATGDADVAAYAGFPYILGREKDNLCQPMTLCFRVANVDTAKFKEERGEINKLYKEFRENGKIKNPREDVLIFKTVTDGILHFNSTRIVKLNPTDAEDVTKAEIEAREQVIELFDFLHNNFSAFKNSSLISTAMSIGIRESRMITGEYVLTGDDIVNCVKFEDSVALGNYDIDIHNPEGTGTSHCFIPEGQYYSIPYRSLVPKNSENLLVAGRCISATHEAQAAIRIMPIVCCLGEAAGIAAAIARKHNCSVKDISISELHKIMDGKNAVHALR